MPKTTTQLTELETLAATFVSTDKTGREELKKIRSTTSADNRKYIATDSYAAIMLTNKETNTVMVDELIDPKTGEVTPNEFYPDVEQVKPSRDKVKATLRLNADYLMRVAKAAKAVRKGTGLNYVDITFHDTDEPVIFKTENGDVSMEALVMPIRM